MGRPHKFTTEELRNIIDLYVEKNAFKSTKLTPTNLAKYSTNFLNKPAHYQDFTRNEEIKSYISTFNEELTKRLIGKNNIMDIPIYQKLNIKKFLDKNNTREKLEKNLGLLEKIREDVHESYAKLFKKFIEKEEELHKKDSEINQLNMEFRKLESSNKDIKMKIKKSINDIEQKNKELREKNRVLETFLMKHHYETIAEYSLYIEGIIASGVKINNKNLMRLEDYKSGNYDLSDVIKIYSYLTVPQDEVNKESEEEEAVSIDEFFENDTFDEGLELKLDSEYLVDSIEEKPKKSQLQEIEDEILNELYD